MWKQSYFNQFSLAKVYSLVELDPYIGPYLVLQLRARMDLEVMTMKVYSSFPKAPALLERHY